jgi:microcystin-dependent protein
LKNNYTPPNLSNCFLRGGINTNIIKTVGGANNVTLNESNLPSHSHSGQTTNVDLNHIHTFDEIWLNARCNVTGGTGLTNEVNT